MIPAQEARKRNMRARVLLESWLSETSQHNDPRQRLVEFRLDQVLAALTGRNQPTREIPLVERSFTVQAEEYRKCLADTDEEDHRWTDNDHELRRIFGRFTSEVGKRERSLELYRKCIHLVCERCGAEPGEPCRDLNIHLTELRYILNPHKPRLEAGEKEAREARYAERLEELDRRPNGITRQVRDPDAGLVYPSVEAYLKQEGGWPIED